MSKISFAARNPLMTLAVIMHNVFSMSHLGKNFSIPLVSGMHRYFQTCIKDNKDVKM